MKKGIIKTIVLAIGILLLQSSALYAGFGVSPTNIYNEFLKPGSHFEKTITLSRSDPAEELLVTIEPTLGEIESWFEFDQGLQFIFPAGENRTSFKVIVDVPENATYRSFEGVIRVRATNNDGEVKGVSIVKGARLDVDLVTTEENVSDLLIRSLKMLDSVDGEPLTLEIVAENLGNVEVSPDAKIVIKNLLMEELEVLESNDLAVIKPNSTDTFQAEFYSTLPEGEYFVEAEVSLEGDVLRKERLVFRIVGQREGDEQVVDSSKILSFVRDYWVYITLSLVLVGLVYLLLTKLWSSERMKEKRVEKWSVLLGSVVVSRIMISVLVAALLAGGSWFVVKTFFVVEDDEVVGELELEIEGDDVIQVEDENDTVKGASTVSSSSPGIDPFVVSIRDNDGNVQYPIYSEPDLQSDVIYHADEGEELAVLEERANWFRVLVNGQIDGWLDKSMVKSTEVEER